MASATFSVGHSIAATQDAIRGAQPAAELTGHPMESLGSATWGPVRGAGDFSQWGDWEAWEQMRIGRVGPDAIGPLPTGSWMVWNAITGQEFGYPPGEKSQKKAEMFATLNNEGKPTRVVFKDGTFVASTENYDAIKAALDRAAQLTEG